MHRLMADFMHAWRVFPQHPGFAATVVLTLALGIGASCAVFNVLNGVILSALPYEQPQRIVRLLGHERGEGVEHGTVAYPDVVDIRERSRSYSGVAAYDEWRPVLQLEHPTVIGGASVDAAFFDVLGVRPALGRFFLAEEGGPGPGTSVVITHELWSNRFDADPAIVGSTLNLSGYSYTVVGVLPADFEDPRLSGGHFHAPQVWRVSPSYFDSASRGSRSYTAIARLKPGVTLEDAESELDSLMRALEQQYPDENVNRTMSLRYLADDVLGGSRTVLWFVFGAVCLLLAIACVNVANLMLVRSAHRAREFGVRNTLGASHAAIGRHVLMESLVLSLIGGAAGLAVAYFATSLLLDMIATALPRPVPRVFDWPVFAFVTVVSVTVGTIISILPILETRRVSTIAAIQPGGAASAGTGLARRMRWLIGVQMTMTVALFLMATLLARSLANLVDVDPGVRAGVLTLQVDALGSDYPEHVDVSRLYDEVLSRLRALPGVTDVGAIDILPLSGSFNGNAFALNDRPRPAAGDEPSAETRSATPGFFTAAGVPLLAGRLIEASDRADTRRVVIVSETLARKHFGDTSAVGAELALFGEDWEIVGVVGDVHQFALDQPPEPVIYVPHEQNSYLWMRRDMTLVVRGGADVVQLAPSLRQAIWSVAPNVAIENVRTMETVLSNTVGPQRFRAMLLSMFAGAALLLGAVGIYGVVAYSVAQRTREVGIRKAVGARAPQIVRLIVVQGMVPAGIGGTVGLAIGLAIAASLRGLLFGVGPADPLALLTAVTVLGATGIAACALPAWRATRISPMRALRYE